ncbi:MAG: hypothetical protein AVDCRST_MAG42-3074 [uncultured Chthoniobacterales bacterium]|uniref:Secreted protein n=1 Tax=uncultured Chthoniobacterales bacterium TaxID=1836801 RepID=A0A6J4J329_9BACT|nr:MAG: hypothetical protein AVDCRST_MAG42-3074 [uncultured Chthoniobacterales bacterium]
MPKLSTLSIRLRQQATSTPVLLSMLGCLALGFAFATSTSHAQGNGGCKRQVCHKQKNTLELPCQSSAYERHLAHGDTPGPCTASQTRQNESTERPPQIAKTRVQPAISNKLISAENMGRIQAAVE